MYRVQIGIDVKYCDCSNGTWHRKWFRAMKLTRRLLGFSSHLNITKNAMRIVNVSHKENIRGAQTVNPAEIRIVTCSELLRAMACFFFNMSADMTSVRWEISSVAVYQKRCRTCATNALNVSQQSSFLPFSLYSSCDIKKAQSRRERRVGSSRDTEHP